MQYQQKLNFYRVENPLYIADFLKHFFLLIGYFDDAKAMGAQGDGVHRGTVRLCSF
jgi:hypothetical protein